MFGFRFLDMIKLVFIGSLLSVTTPALAKAPSNSLIDEAVLSEIRNWLQVPVVFIMLDAQNARYASLSKADIVALDKQWRAERKTEDQPLIASMLNNPLSSYLTQMQAGSAGLFTEIFVMDKQGLNAGQSSITSDFWQGDEAKFQKTFEVGPDAVFIDEAEYSEETGTWRAQVNLTIQSQDARAVGAVTVEVNLTELARRVQVRREGE